MKAETSQDIRRSSFAIKKRNKRRNATASESCSIQTVATEQLAKKKRKEPVAAPHPRKVPALEKDEQEKETLKSFPVTNRSKAAKNSGGRIET